jgi:hypothetical protein
VAHLGEMLTRMTNSCLERANDDSGAQNYYGDHRPELRMPKFDQFCVFLSISMARRIRLGDRACGMVVEAQARSNNCSTQGP